MCCPDSGTKQTQAKSQGLTDRPSPCRRPLPILISQKTDPYTLGVTRIIRRGAQCLPEQPLAPADNCAFKSKANHEELAFATASPASKGPAVSLQHWPASPLRSKSSVPPPNTFASGIKEPSSYSGSAQFVGLPSFTQKTVTLSLWASPWARLLTLAFRRLAFPSTTGVGTHGFSCRQARKRSTKIPLDRKL
jgi:hypothetical protein